MKFNIQYIFNHPIEDFELIDDVINQEFNINNEIQLERTTIMGKLIWDFAL